MSETPSHRAGNGNAAIVLAGVVFVVSVIAFVALEIAGRNTDNLMVLVGPAIGALIVSGQLVGQNKALDKIERQTNGVMDGRIEAGVRKVLTEAGVLAIPSGSTTPLEPPT